jgi:hypothetical protein
MTGVAVAVCAGEDWTWPEVGGFAVMAVAFCFVLWLMLR